MWAWVRGEDPSECSWSSNAGAHVVRMRVAHRLALRVVHGERRLVTVHGAVSDDGVIRQSVTRVSQRLAVLLCPEERHARVPDQHAWREKGERED